MGDLIAALVLVGLFAGLFYVTHRQAREQDAEEQRRLGLEIDRHLPEPFEE